MAQQQGIGKENALWENSRAGFSIGALLQELGGFSKLSANNLRTYVSHPNPAADYAEAVRRVESKIASEVNFYEGSHSFLPRRVCPHCTAQPARIGDCELQ